MIILKVPEAKLMGTMELGAVDIVKVVGLRTL
jgi:hypothetical protein